MKRLLVLSLLGSLSACAVGPDFEAPEAALPQQWTTAAAQGPLDAQWWRSFNDAQLTSLVERATAANLDIRSALLRVEQSRDLRGVSAAALGPQVGAGAGYQQERNSSLGLNDPSGRQGESPFELWSLAADAGWEVDLWGHVRRSVEMADAQVRLTQAERDGVLLSIAALTATDYLNLRGTQQQLQVVQQNLELARQSRQLTQTRFDNGVTTQLDVANSAAQVATIEARLAPLEAQRDRLVNALSYLLAEPPQALAQELALLKSIPQVAEHDVPLGIPSELARRRPDILQSEAALHQATAAMGVAKADFYPRVSIGASLGFQALHGSDIGNWQARDWSYGPSLYLPIFQGGRLSSTLALREHQQQAAAINYRKVVLGAWHEVDNALRDYAAEQRHRQALAEAVRQNQRALDSARLRYAQGAIDFINVLSVQRELLQTQSEWVASSTKTVVDRVQLYRALAGGWPVVR